jgi:DNA-binding transcriptional regulator YiaG
MPDFKQSFQDEVRRLARKELKALDEKISEQKKTINALQKRISELEKKQAVSATVPVAEKKQDAPAQDAKGRKARFSPKSIAKFRKKFFISQKALAKLMDVTPFTISHWELGKNRPRPNQIEAFNTLTKLGKRKLYALVAEKAPEELPAQKPAGRKKSAVPAKRGRKAAGKKAEAAVKAEVAVKAEKAVKAPAKAKAPKKAKSAKKAKAPAAPAPKAPAKKA